jgi:hypothetical protein
VGLVATVKRICNDSFMGIIGWLFGKKPFIHFTKDGKAVHEHEARKWSDWEDRFRKNPMYNWRDHAGKHGGSALKAPADKGSPEKR